jgi:hypothetical protein
MGFASWEGLLLLVYDHKYLFIVQGDKLHFLKNYFGYLSSRIGIEMSFCVILLVVDKIGLKMYF